MPKHESLNYAEFSTQDMAATKTFFEKSFGWKIDQYGPEESPNYMDYFEEQFGVGFYPDNKASTTESGGALVMLYSESLEATQAKVEAAGGKVIRPIFTFPGGRRFQFTEPGGNELSVWSDKEG